LLFTTSTGHPLEPRNVKRSFDSRCRRAGVRRIKIQDTRRTCGSLLAALDVHPRPDPRPDARPGPARPCHQRRHRRTAPRAHHRPGQELPAHRQATRTPARHTTPAPPTQKPRTLTRVRGVLDVLRHHTVELRGFEPLTFCMPCSTVSSDSVALRPVTALQSSSIVRGRLARSGKIGAGWSLVWSWFLPDLSVTDELAVPVRSGPRARCRGTVPPRCAGRGAPWRPPGSGPKGS
jgi:hypothetical protein